METLSTRMFVMHTSEKSVYDILVYQQSEQQGVVTFRTCQYSYWLFAGDQLKNSDQVRIRKKCKYFIQIF